MTKNIGIADVGLDDNQISALWKYFGLDSCESIESMQGCVRAIAVLQHS